MIIHFSPSIFSINNGKKTIFTIKKLMIILVLNMLESEPPKKFLKKRKH